MVQILLPEALYVVTTTAPWAHVASHRYWNLELELRVDDSRLPLRNVETDTAVQHLSGSLFVTSILHVDGNDFDTVAVGNQLVAVNDADLGGLDVLEMHRLLRAATDTAPTHLLFLRHDYADANVALRHVRPPLSSPFEVATFTHNEVTWYFSPSYALFADNGHPRTVSWTSRAWQLWREAQTRLCTLLYSWDEIVVALEEKMWQHLCALLLDEYLWPEMKIPYIAHLNLNSDARDALYCQHFTAPSSQTWGLELAVQAPYALTTTSLSSTPKGIVIVTKVPSAQDHLAVMVGDILVAINHIFLTTAIPSALKKLQRVASRASPLHPASLLFLRYDHFGIARHLAPTTAVPPSPMSIASLLSSLYPPALDPAVVQRLPLQVDALQWLFSQANAFTTHRVQNQLWYAHHKSQRVFAEHPLRILVYPVVEAARRRLLWTVRWVELRWQRRLRLLAAVDAMQNRVIRDLLEAAINVCIQHTYTPVVIDYTRHVVDGTIKNVLDDLVHDEEQIFVASLDRFRFLHRDTELEATKPLPTHTVVRRADRRVPRRVDAAPLDGPPPGDPLDTHSIKRLLNARTTFATVQVALRLRNVATSLQMIPPARGPVVAADWMSSPDSTLTVNPMVDTTVFSTQQETELLTIANQINGVSSSTSGDEDGMSVQTLEDKMDHLDTAELAPIRSPTRDVPMIEAEATVVPLPTDASATNEAASNNAYPESQWVEISYAAMPVPTDDISPTMSIDGGARLDVPQRLDDPCNAPATESPTAPNQDGAVERKDIFDGADIDAANDLLMDEVDRIIEFQPRQASPAASPHGARKVSLTVNTNDDRSEQPTPEAARSEAPPSTRRRSIPPLLPHPVVVQPWHLSVPTSTLAPSWQQKNTAVDIRSERVIPRLQLDKLAVRAWNDGHAKTKKKLPRRKPTVRQIQAATRIQACFRGYHCRMVYRIKRDKLRRRTEARTRLGALSPFLNERPQRFPRLPTRSVQGGRNQAAPFYDDQDPDTSFLRTQLTDREEELMEELKVLNHALESRRKVHAAPRLPRLSKSTSFGSK